MIASIVAGVALVGGLLIYLPFASCRAVGLNLADDTLQGLDSAGRPCWQRRFPGVRTDLRIDDRVLHLDVDRDRSPEFLFDFSPAERARGVLYCLDSSGEILWAHHYGSNRDYLGRPFDNVYVGYGVHPITSKGEEFLMLLTGHWSWFPSQVQLLRPATGQVLDTYWHPGRLTSAAFADLNGNGRPEAILGGVNNPNDGLGHPSLAVLEIPFRGSAPDGLLKYFPVKFTGAREKEYLLLPRPAICDIVSEIAIVRSVSVDSTGRLHAQLDVPTPNGIAVLAYYFDTSLELLEVHPSDNLLKAYRELVAKGVLGPETEQLEKRRWRQVERFPTAPDANSPEIEALFNRDAQ